MTPRKAPDLARLDAAVLDALHGRSMLLTQDWTTAEIDTLCALAETLQALDRRGLVPALFPQQLFWGLFFDQSTRTKSSWAGAAARLGGQAVIVDGSSTQVSHGETSVETGAMLGMNSHALGIRHDLILGEGNRFMRDAKQGIDDYLAATGDDRVVPVVNLQCDIDHPTQALADLLWLRERLRDGLAGRTLTMSWAYSPSYAKPLSVAQGTITLLTRFGMHVQARAPGGVRAHGPVPRCRALQRGGVGRLVHRHPRHGRGVRRCRRRLPQELGPVRPDAGARRGQREPGHRRPAADRAAGARAERVAPGLDLRRAPHGPHARGRCAVPALPPGRHRGRGQPGRDGTVPPRSRAPGEQEGLRDHGAARGSEGHRTSRRRLRRQRRRPSHEARLSTMELDSRISELARRYRPLADRDPQGDDPRARGPRRPIRGRRRRSPVRHLQPRGSAGRVPAAHDRGDRCGRAARGRLVRRLREPGLGGP